MSRHPLPAADAAWLHMDRATNPMVVNALVMVDRPVAAERVVDLLEARVVGLFPRFRQRIAESHGRGPAFEDDPAFAIEDHVHRLALPSPGDRAALQELVGDLITAPLDHDRPLWQAYLIEGYGDGAALLVRIHHCIADGIALARVMLSITDGAGTPAAPAVRPHHGLLNRSANAAATVTGAAIHEGVASLLHPRHVGELAGAALRDSATVAKLLGSPADAETALREPLAGTRRVAWSEPFPLDRVKAAGRPLRSTINDLLVAALAGALRDYLATIGPVPDEVHAMVPFNLRPPNEPLSPDLGNDFSLILLALPVGIADRTERVLAVRERMNAIKHSHEAPISYGILSALGHAPAAVEDRLIGFFTDKASVVVTNVPGPREQVSFAGAPVTGVLVWAPCSGSLGMTVSIFSYAGEVTVGFMADVALVPDPDRLAEAFERELSEMC